MWKGIILAGGSGSRLFPLTYGISKQLLPIYDKPMIFYPISIFMMSGIREILIIVTPQDETNFIRLLGDGSDFGLKIEFKVQESPRGIAEAFIIGEEFIADNNVALILGDNIFYGNEFSAIIEKVKRRQVGATIFGYQVNDPERFGVIEFKDGLVSSIDEKPTKPKSNYAIPGLYFYDNNVVEFAKSLKPSKRGELEITDLNKIYLDNQNLYASIIGRGVVWLDAGTKDSLVNASSLIKTIEDRQGLKIACLEEISYRNNWLNKQQIKNIILKYKNSDYGKYLSSIID